MKESTLTDLLGFTKAEERIWQTIQKGLWNISEISTFTKFPRTTLYTALASLKKRGMITTRSKGKAVIVSPTPGHILSDLLAESATTFRDDGNIKVIKKHTTGSQSGFTFIHGKKAMLKVWERMAQKGVGRFYAIQPTRSLLNTIKLFKPGEFVPINNAIKKNKIIVDAIAREDGFPEYMKAHKDKPSVQKDIINSFLGRMTDMTHVKNEYLNNNAELIITSRSAFLMNWEHEVGIEIENKDMVDFLRELFELAKGYGKKINFNEYMQDYLKRV